jgi:hypothetical protein
MMAMRDVHSFVARREAWDKHWDTILANFLKAGLEQ